MTPHNGARQGDYAEAVLLPGDPQRAAWIAETLLDGVRQVNSIRGALGFTGTYKGVPVSIQTTGIGRPSLSIYVHELLAVYGVKSVIRVGTCGGLQEAVGIRSVIIASSAAMDFEMDSIDAWRRPDEKLFAHAIAAAEAGGFDHFVSPMICSDVFYHGDPLGRFARARMRGVLACDMETSALLGMAARFGARALSICTVVDNLVSGLEIEQSERQAVFGPMARIALEAVAADAAARPHP